MAIQNGLRCITASLTALTYAVIEKASVAEVGNLA